MANKSNILYIGPYNEHSGRGKDCLTNIHGLVKAGHNLKIVPIYYPGHYFKETPENLVELESNSIDHYDISIQHCDPTQYSFNSNIDKNIGIYEPKSLTSEPIINSHFSLLDNVVVTSKNVHRHLKNLLNKNLYNTTKFCNKHISLDWIVNHKKTYMDWRDNSKYYFYTELEFTNEYDWEQIIYVYFKSLIHKQCSLVIRTQEINDKQYAKIVNDKINSIAMYANINPNQNNMPLVINGVLDTETSMNIYHSIDCFIDATRTYKLNRNLLMAAALKKDIICNAKLSFAELFPQTYLVEPHSCNINCDFENDMFSYSMYDQYYSMDTVHLEQIMSMAYLNRYDSDKISYEELQPYDITNINNLLC